MKPYASQMCRDPLELKLEFELEPQCMVTGSLDLSTITIFANMKLPQVTLFDDTCTNELHVIFPERGKQFSSGLF